MQQKQPASTKSDTDKAKQGGSTTEKPALSEAGESSPHYFPVLGIGTSAGGLAALRQLFAKVPEQTGAAYVIVMHLSPEHESHLVEILQPHIPIPVQQVTETTGLEKDRVYIIPPNANLDAIDSHLRVTKLEMRRQERAPIDHFFRTLADSHKELAIGVVLTGTGSDGTLGLRQIKEHGGLTVVQDPNEAEYDGMPRSAIGSAPVDLVLPLDEILPAVLRYIRTEPQLPVSHDGQEDDRDAKQFLQKALAVVRTQTKRDFSHYKRPTLLRRIARRMQFNHIQEPGQYLDLLQKQPGEVRSLADDLLINVTSFFRDPDVFAALQQNIVGKLFEGKKTSDSLRVWSVGCATGEEAYSLAILLLEHATKLDAAPEIQVFASDLHKGSLKRARDGLYSGDIEVDVSPERLRRFFTKEGGGYRIKMEVRERVIFAQHDVLSDPPFSRLDLVSCRNLFIYLDRNLHQQVTELFHYALKPDGYLVLGTSESVSESEFFQVQDKKNAIYRRRNVTASEPRLPVFSLSRMPADAGLPATTSTEDGSYRSIHQRLVEQYASPSLLLSPDNHVVHFSTHAGRYLQHPGGAPTTNVFKLVREELRADLRTAVSEARHEQKDVRAGPINVGVGRESSPVVLDVRPMLGRELEGFVLLVFDEQPALAHPEKARPAAREEGKTSSVDVRELLAEKEAAEQKLQRIIRDYETGQEVLRATNEELQSANEELRSTLEELETSKEELQSINEELQTVNQENRHKVDELSQLSADLQNLFAATDIATIFLDRDMRIVRFTPKTSELFNVQLTDRGRRLTDFTHRLQHMGIEDDARQVLERLVPVEREVRDGSGRWYLMRVLPYRVDDRISGTVITLVEISQRKEMEDALRQAKQYSENIIESLPGPLLVLNADLVVESANHAFYKHFGVRQEETLGRRVYDLGNGQWSIPALRRLLEDILPDNKTFDGYEVDHQFETLGRRVMLINGRQLDSQKMILLGINDITERHRTEQALAEAHAQLLDIDRRKNSFLATLSHELRNPLAPIKHGLYVLERVEPASEQAHRAMEIMNRQVNQMTRLIDDLLDVTRIVHGKTRLEPEPLDLNEVVARIADDYRDAFARSEIDFELDAAARELCVSGDRTRLSQAIGNLLQNAHKFTPRGGTVRLSTDADESRQQAVVRVADTGLGLAPEMFPHLFTPFAQADTSLDRSKGGLGLGLALVKGIAELHGGEVSAASDGLGRGASFTLVLPLQAECPPPSKPAAAAGGPSPRRVLVIEDNEDAAQSLREALELNGHNVSVAADGSSGIIRAREFRPEVVICDIGLPEMDGFEVARRLRADSSLSRLKLVALTGYAALDDVTRCRDAGFDAHLAKPVDIESLERVMAEISAQPEEAE